MEIESNTDKLFNDQFLYIGASATYIFFANEQILAIHYNIIRMVTYKLILIVLYRLFKRILLVNLFKMFLFKLLFYGFFLKWE